MTKSPNVKIFKNFEQPKGEGTYYRLMCLTGQDKGKAYFLFGQRMILGRSEQADIPVLDIKSSREHAELIQVAGGHTVTDLGSHNGILVNDQKVKQATLKDGDKFVIGSTVYKYSVIKIEAAPLVVTPAAAPTVQKKSDEDEEIESDEEETKVERGQRRSGAIFSRSQESSSGSGSGAGSGGSRRTLVIGLVVVLGAVLFFAPDDEKQTVAGGRDVSNDAAKKDITREISSIPLGAGTDDRELKKNLEVIFQRGLREAREGNYFRAINEFNLALILSPQNGRASYYLQKTKQQLDDEISKMFINGRRFADARRYEAASNQYCSIMRLLQGYPDDERYQDAETNVRDIEHLMGLEPGEIKCL